TRLCVFRLQRHAVLDDLHSFPTRRASDLGQPVSNDGSAITDGMVSGDGRIFGTYLHGLFTNDHFRRAWLESLGAPGGQTPFHQRSEEHTSELLSRENLVCRLLLEKKKEPH